MHINPNIEKPIFIQIAEQLEDSIFTKVFPEETKIPSTNELSSLLNIIFLLFNLSTILYNFIFKFYIKKEGITPLCFFSRPNRLCVLVRCLKALWRRRSLQPALFPTRRHGLRYSAPSLHSALPTIP